MVKSVESGKSLPPFLVKCYEMVSDDFTDDLISWTESDDSFIILDESKFSSQLLPKYFKHSNFSSFVRQLNIYGFKKIDTDHWQFANEFFIKGQKHLLKNIVRRKHGHGQDLVQKNSSQKDADTGLQSEEDKKRIALRKEVESLNTDKVALSQELDKLRQHQQTSQSQLLVLSKQLKGMEMNQQQMLSFIVLAMRSPEFKAQFFQRKDNSWRMAENCNTKLSEVTDDCEITPSDGMIVRYQPPRNALPEPVCPTEDSTIEDLMDLDLSSDEMKDFLMDIELLVGPMVDENLPSFDHPGRLVLPDIPENDIMLEELLSSDPQYELPAELEVEAHIGSEVHSGLILQPKESDESNGSADDINGDQNQIIEDTKIQTIVDSSEKVEVLTKK